MFFQHGHLSVTLGSNMHQNCLFMWMYSPLEQEAHSCKSVLHRVQQKSNFLDWMCFRMPSCRIRAAKRISKNHCKYVYYLHMGRSWGSLNFCWCFKFLHFYSFLFFVLVSRERRLAAMRIFSVARGELGQMSSYFFVFSDRDSIARAPLRSFAVGT